MARALDAPLDVLVVRKLGALGLPEVGIGALVDGDQPEAVLDERAVEALGVDAAYLRAEIARQLRETRCRQASVGSRPS